MASNLVPAWDTRTGVKRLVPEKWFDHDDMSANLTRKDPKITPKVPEGHNSPTRPDDPDFPEPSGKGKTSSKSGDTTNPPPAGDQK